MSNKLRKYEFDTEKLLKMFGLPSAELDPSTFDAEFGHSEDELFGIAEEHGIDVGSLEGEERTELLNIVVNAVDNATFSGVEGRYQDAVFGALAQVLETFSNYRYEYYSETDGRSYSGTAKGIVISSIGIGWDKTTFEAHDDLANVVQDCIAGYGMFDVDGNFEGETPYEYAKSRFSWLKHYWEIYGGGLPEIDDRYVYDGFDDKYFRELMKEIKNQFKK